MSRLERLHALAWTLPDVQPAPSSGGGVKGAIRGETPGGWAMCEDCGGEGVTFDKWRRSSVCETCDGAGRFRVDVFTGQRVAAVDSTAPPRGRRATCDRCGGSGVMLGRYVGGSGLVRCDSCDGAGGVLVPFGSDDPAARRVTFDGSALSRVRARGDWDALEAGVGWLRDTDAGLARVWVRVRVHDVEPWSPSVATRVVDADRRLLAGLPEALRCPAEVVAAFRARREMEARREAARRERLAGVGRGRGRRRAAELLRMGYEVAEAARLAGVSASTARRAAREVAGV